MTSALPRSWQLAVRFGLFSTLAGSVGAACCNRVSYIYPYASPQATALPAGCPVDRQPADTTELRACLQNLEFDSTPAAGDEQRLMVVDSSSGPRCKGGDTTLACRYGPLAKIEPVRGAETYSDSALGQGRIIARMFLRAGETESYPKLGLVPGDTTYYWVSTAKDSSYFVHPVTADANLAPTGRGLTREAHPVGTYQQALAQWVWDENDEKANGPCGSGCCRP